MEVKIQIRTPKGQARKTEKKLRPFLLGLGQTPKLLKTNKDDNKIIWTIEGPPKNILKIHKNVARYDTLLEMIFNHRFVKKVVKKALSKDEQAELYNMILNHTSVTILKASHTNPDPAAT